MPPSRMNVGHGNIADLCLETEEKKEGRKKEWMIRFLVKLLARSLLPSLPLSLLPNFLSAAARPSVRRRRFPYSGQHPAGYGGGGGGGAGVCPGGARLCAAEAAAVFVVVGMRRGRRFSDMGPEPLRGLRCSHILHSAIVYGGQLMWDHFGDCLKIWGNMRRVNLLGLTE